MDSHIRPCPACGKDYLVLTPCIWADGRCDDCGLKAGLEAMRQAGARVACDREEKLTFSIWEVLLRQAEETSGGKL